MILTITGADFSGANIGTNISVRVSVSVSVNSAALSTAHGIPSYVDKGSSVSWTITLKEGYTFGENIVVSMEGSGSITKSISGNTLTINSMNVTGKITINVPTSGGEAVEPEPEEPDTDVNEITTAFLTATGITDSTISNKINTLVNRLISANLWDKIDALYPCVGSNFEQMSYNLKNPSTFKMRSSSGVAPNVDSTGILGTQLVLCDNYTTAPGDNFHTLAWNKIGYSMIDNLKIALCGVCIGEGLGDGGVQVQFYDNGKEGQAQIRTRGKEGRWNCKPCDVNPTGLVISSLTSGIIHNGVSIGAVKEGTPKLTKTGGNIGINGMADGGKPYLGHRGLAGFGKGLTIEEMQAYSDILNDFKEIY